MSGIKAVIHNESSAVCLALLKKINCIDSISLNLTEQLAFFVQEIPSTQKIAKNIIGSHFSSSFYFFLDEILYLGLAGKIALDNLKMLNITSLLESIFSYHSLEVLAEFIVKLSLQQRDQLVLPLHLPEVQCRLPHFLLQELQSESANVFYIFLSTYKPLKNKLISDKETLLTNCINFYFEGKGEIPQKIKFLFIECLNAKKNLLSLKEKTFLEILESEVSVIAEPWESNAYNIWKKGVLSWRHYRHCRLQQDNYQLQEVLDRLARADLLFKGSPACFSNFFSSSTHSVNAQKNIDDGITVLQALECIQQIKGLVKIIKPQDWNFFIHQLENLNNRPKLRNTVHTPTHKFIHLTGEIVVYQKKRRKKANYTHTKKTATTLLSSQMNTSVFGEKDPKSHLLIGVLFDQTQCQVKAMLLKDSMTFMHSWLGNQSAVSKYKDQMIKINQTNWDIFVQEANNRFRYNEVLAKVNKTAMRAIFIAQDTPEARLMSLQRRDEIAQKFSIRLPIIFYSSLLQTTRHYTLNEQEDDFRAWNEKQKVCTPRELVSKENVLSIYNACVNKTDWQLGLFGSNTRVQNKSVPRTFALCKQLVNTIFQSEQAEGPVYTWVEAEKNIKDALAKKINQNRFFQLCQGRSNDTVEFYKSLLKQHF